MEVSTVDTHQDQDQDFIGVKVSAVEKELTVSVFGSNILIFVSTE